LFRSSLKTISFPHPPINLLDSNPISTNSRTNQFHNTHKMHFNVLTAIEPLRSAHHVALLLSYITQVFGPFSSSKHLRDAIDAFRMTVGVNISYLDIRVVLESWIAGTEWMEGKQTRQIQLVREALREMERMGCFQMDYPH
jgi:hypothetical protein